MSVEENVTDMWEVCDALKGCLQACDPDKRKMLAQTLDAYEADFPDEFFWAVGALSPTLLSGLLMTIDMACRENGKPRKNVLRLADRKQGGTA
jgi:hypothetical protein